MEFGLIPGGGLIQGVEKCRGLGVSVRWNARGGLVAERDWLELGVGQWNGCGGVNGGVTTELA